MNIKVASWNIAGGHKIASLGHFDYQPEDVSYFVDQLRRVSPDIICLQESHTKIDGSRSNASDIAKSLDMKMILNSPNSPPHIDESFRLGNAIISKWSPTKVIEVFYPDPEGQLYWANGTEALTHKKNLQVAMFEKFNVANNQMLPVSLFGFTYDDKDRGAKLTQEINTIMGETVAPPLIWAGDFNYQEPLNIYPTMTKLKLSEALPDVSTRPTKDNSKKKSDHIFFTPEFKLLGSKVVITESDHYLCWAELEI